MALIIVIAVGHCLGCSTPASSREALELSPQPAARFIVQAFDSYPLVALSEMHGNTESQAFLASLIREPGFSGRVNDIVVEFGNARYQTIVDRYIAGESVDRDELRGTWENTTQVSGIWLLPMYEAILGDIRSVNVTLPPNRRFRVLLGDPPVDWRSVISPADDDFNDQRDAYFAWVVQHQVLEHRRKALLFVGGAHISRKVVFPNSLIHLLDARFPGNTLVVSAIDVGSMDRDAADRLKRWPIPWAAKVRGTWLGRSDVKIMGSKFSVGAVEDDIDAVLYLSAAPLIFQQPPAVPPSIAVEMQRRRRLAQDTLRFRGARIRFESSLPTLTASSREPMASVLRELLRDRSLRVVVKALADRHEAAALHLPLMRASLVTDWLTRRGVEARRLRAMGCGAVRPLWADDAEEHQAANRRAEIVRMTETASCEPAFDRH